MAGAWFFHAPAAHAAAVLSLASGNCSTCEGVTYELDMATTSGSKTASFTLTITGENTASDIRGGRTGVEAFALGDPAGDISTASVSSPPGYSFVDGGLSNSGSPSGDCNGSGNFFCFHNLAITNASPQVSGTLTFAFTATTVTGDWSHYGDTLADDPSFKINWVGSAPNYDLVSKEIPVNTSCPDCVINPTDGGSVPEPASFALLGLGCLGLLYSRRKR